MSGRRSVWDYIDSSDFVVVGLMTAGMFLLFAALFIPIFLFGGESWWWGLITAGVIAFIVAFGGTLIILGRAIYEWYEYNSWRR